MGDNIHGVVGGELADADPDHVVQRGIVGVDAVQVPAPDLQQRFVNAIDVVPGVFFRDPFQSCIISRTRSSILATIRTFSTWGTLRTTKCPAMP